MFSMHSNRAHRRAYTCKNTRKSIICSHLINISETTHCYGSTFLAGKCIGEEAEQWNVYCELNCWCIIRLAGKVPHNHYECIIYNKTFTQWDGSLHNNSWWTQVTQNRVWSTASRCPRAIREFVKLAMTSRFPVTTTKTLNFQNSRLAGCLRLVLIIHLMYKKASALKTRIVATIESSGNHRF
jgi:hypothetical protein